MQFLTDNLVWIIVVAVIIVMAIIGYFADKSGFGTAEFEKKAEEPKPKKEKKSKNKKVKEQPEQITLPNKPIDEIINERADVNQTKPTSEEVMEEQPVAISDEVTLITPETVEEKTDMAEIPEDLFAPISNETTVQEPVVEAVPEEISEDKAPGSEWVIPEEKKEEPAPVVTEEDIWKF